ncbi:PREDICTED: BPI fold-containing family A member 1-like [Chrysochloris asiatica]|uniref:BPI fold-containing family A member 1-like n=1 Tax=Chrysochloris asiatica TaxID=185453 RepID=A0A9B0TFY7_CHRAS|nr:PREDICTED: BPI fold-containing family A member 1-like [Chrysochloris asiatica]
MLLFWGLLLCWGLLPQTRGEAQHLLFHRISIDQLETDISDMFSKNHVLERMTKIPVTGDMSKGMPILDHLPFVRENLSKKKTGLDLSIVGDLLSGKKLPVVEELIRAGGLVIEDAKGPEVTLEILSYSLLQVTLRCKLYVSLQGILRLKIIKNIRIGVGLEQTRNKTKVVLKECYTPPGYLSIKLLETINPLLVNEALELVSKTLDEVLPFLLQKIVCPKVSTLLNLLLEDLLQFILPPTISGAEDFQYYVITTELMKDTIVMEILLVTPCGQHQRVQWPDHQPPQPLPKLAHGSMADLVFWQEVYNGILSCLYTSEVIHVDAQDPMAVDLVQLLWLRELDPEPKASLLSGESMVLTISTPESPTVHLDNGMAMLTQPGSLALLGPSNTSFSSVSWKLHSKAVFSSRNRILNVQIHLDR